MQRYVTHGGALSNAIRRLDVSPNAPTASGTAVWPSVSATATWRGGHFHDPRVPRGCIALCACDGDVAGCGGHGPDRRGGRAGRGSGGRRARRAQDRAADGHEQRLGRGLQGQAAGVRARDQACQRRRRRIRPARGGRHRRHHGRAGDGGGGSAASRRGRGRACHGRPQRQRQRAADRGAGDRSRGHPHRQLLGHVPGADGRRRQRFPVSNRAFRRLAGARPRPRRARAGLRQCRPAPCRRPLGAGACRRFRSRLGRRPRLHPGRPRPDRLPGRAARGPRGAARRPWW